MLVSAFVHLLDTPDGVIVCLVIQMYAVWANMTAQELATVIVWLVVEFLFVQCYTLLCQSATQFWKQGQEILVSLLRHNEHDVVHEADELHAAFIGQP